MKIKNKKVFVSGADGFIGSHLVETLVSAGCDVTALAYYNSFNSWGWLEDLEEDVKSKVKIVNGDVRDSGLMRKLIKGQEVVFHLAALISIPYSYEAPESFVQTNVLGTLNVLEAAREAGVQKVIITSTSEVYGTPETVPISETHALKGQSPYSASKIGADQLALSFYYTYNLPVSIIRPFNTYGPRQSARAVIPTIISQIANGEREIKLGSTHPTRDFNFIKDTVSGFIAVAESEKSLGEVINIGSNFEISIGDLVNQIASLMDTKITILEDTDRIRPENSEVLRLNADNQKALNLTDWNPSYSGLTGLQEGLRETIEWFRDQNNLKQYKHNICNI